MGEGARCLGLRADFSPSLMVGATEKGKNRPEAPNTWPLLLLALRNVLAIFQNFIFDYFKI